MRIIPQVFIIDYLGFPFPFERASKLNGIRMKVRSSRHYFAKIKEFRGIATRYDKTDESFQANINLAATIIAAR